MRLFGGVLMASVEDLALRLARSWVDNYSLHGREAFQQNEALRASIVAEAEKLGIRDKVYSRANDIFRGE
jgi:hypothetical protein